MHQSSQRSKRFVIAFILLSVLGTACATVQERPEAAPAANLVVTPNSGLPGAQIAILGSGFKPGEVIEVIIEIEGVPTELGSKPMVKKANDVGAFMTTSNIPRDSPPGVYAIMATGDKGTVAAAPLSIQEKPKKK